MSEDAVCFTLLNKSDWFELLCQAHDFVLFQACSAYLPFLPPFTCSNGGIYYQDRGHVLTQCCLMSKMSIWQDQRNSFTVSGILPVDWLLF